MFISSLRLLYIIFWSYLPLSQLLAFPLPSPLATSTCTVLICKHIKSTLCELYSWMHGPQLTQNQLTRVAPVKKTWLCLTWQLLVAITSSARSGTLCPPPLCMAGFGLIWARASLMCESQSLWLYIYSICCPENSVSVRVSTTSGSHTFPATSPKINPKPWKECV